MQDSVTSCPNVRTCDAHCTYPIARITLYYYYYVCMSSLSRFVQRRNFTQSGCALFLSLCLCNLQPCICIVSDIFRVFVVFLRRLPFQHGSPLLNLFRCVAPQFIPTMEITISKQFTPTFAVFCAISPHPLAHNKKYK